MFKKLKVTFRVEFYTLSHHYKAISILLLNLICFCYQLTTKFLLIIKTESFKLLLIIINRLKKFKTLLKINICFQFKKYLT